MNYTFRFRVDKLIDNISALCGMKKLFVPLNLLLLARDVDLVYTNQDGILNNQDEAFNYVLLREDDNGGVTLFIPQVDKQKAKELFAVILNASEIISSVSLYKDSVIQFKEYTTIKTNINNRKISSTYKEFFASIKKHLYTYQDNLWHVVQTKEAA